MEKLNGKLTRVWMPPLDLREMPQVIFKIHRDGSVSDIKILKSAGSTADKSAIAAIEKASPFDSLPASANDTVEISYTFNRQLLKENGVGIKRHF